MSKLGDGKVFITKQAISKIHEVKFEGLQDSKGLQELHKELLRISMDENNSNEVLTIVKVNDFQGNKSKAITLGKERSVNPNNNQDAVNLMLKSSYQSVYWLHNHAFTSDFSYDDLGCFFDSRVKALTIVTNKGKVAVLNKTKNYNEIALYDIIKQERSKYKDVVKNADSIAKAVIKRHKEYGVQWIR